MTTDLTLEKLAYQIEELQEKLTQFNEVYQQKLQAIEERWQLLFQGTTDGLWDWNIVTNELMVSPRWKEMLGYGEEELPSHFDTWISLLHPKDKERCLQTLEDYLAQNIPHYSVIFRLRSKGGSYKWILARGQAKWDEKGQPIRMAGSHTDITQQKEMEESLELEKSLLRSVIDCIPDAIFYKDHRGIYLACNQAFQDRLGRDEHEIIGTTDFDLFERQSAEISEKLEEKMLIEKQSQRHEEWVTYSDGQQRLLDTLKTPLFDYQGEVIGLIGISRDITERNKKEFALKAQAERNKLLSRIARQFIDQPLDIATQYTLAAIGEFTHSDRAYIIHYSSSQDYWSMQKEWCKIGISSLLNFSQNLPVSTFPWFAKQLLEGHPIMINKLEDIPPEATLERDTFQYSQSPTLIVVPMVNRGKPFGYLGLDGNRHKIWTQEDVSFLQLVGEFIAIANTRAQAEADLKKAKEDADKANRAKSEFLANMSHELRSPLNGILGFVQVMNRQGNLTPEQQQNLDIINRSGEYLLGLINDVLEMSKIEAGRTTLNVNSFDLYHLLNNLELLAYWQANTKGLQLIFERTPDVPQYIRTDEGKLRQVLLNLLSNSLKFTHEGGVTLRVKPGHHPHSLHFEVEDTGDGIAEAELGLLFQAFSQTEAGRRAQQGTGLGLPIAQKFVTLMGGEIQVQSTVGQGSLFSFQINIELAKENQIKAPQDRRKVLTLAPNQPEYRILIVDDRSESRQLLLKLLTSVGFTVKEAKNGQEALHIWEKWQPHLICMDMRMPILDGYATTQCIKQTSQGQKTIIIALTATAFAEDREAILRSGCDDFMRKPFREDDLWEKMEHHLGVKYLYEEPTETPNPNHFYPDLTSPLQLKTQLAQMPPMWQDHLRQMALECRDDEILPLLRDIPTELADLSQTLPYWAENYWFDRILDLLEEPID